MTVTLSASGINWLAVAVVTLLSFVLGSLWHSPVLFGKTWKEESGFKFDMSKKSNMIILFLTTGLLHLVTLAGLAMFVGPAATLGEGLHKGLFVSVMFILPAIAATHLFPGRTWKLILIDAGFYVVFFVIAGMIFGAWH